MARSKRTMLPEVEYTVAIRVNERTGGDLPGLFDMMRYEHATLESWDHFPSSASLFQFEVTLRTARVRFTPDRWASFGLFPKEVE